MTVTADSLQKSISSPVFLFEVSPSEGSVVAPTYQPFTIGRFTLGTLPYQSARSGVTTFYFSDADWTGGQTQPPDLSLDFTDEIPSNLTFTRASDAWAWDANGMFASYGTDVARAGVLDERGVPRGILIEGARTNYLRHSDMDGAAAGAPGVIPTDWQEYTAGGISREIVAVGDDNGMPYMDVRYSGTSTADATAALFFEEDIEVVAADGENWTLTCFIKLVAGSLSNIDLMRLVMVELDSGPTDLVFHQGGNIVPTKSSLSSQRFRLSALLTGGTTASLLPFWEFYFTTGMLIDFTVRVSLPQLEKGEFPSSPIVTAGAAVTRAADVCTMAVDSAWWSASGNMMYAEADIPFAGDSANYRRIFTLDNGAAAEILGPSLLGGNIRWEYRHSTTYQAQLVLGAATYGANTQVASRYALNDFAAVLGSSLVTDVSGTLPVPTGLRIGYRNSGSNVEQLFGYIKRLDIWKGTGFTNTQIESLSNALPYPPLWAGPASGRENVHYEGRCSAPSMDRSLPLTPEASVRSVLSIGDIKMDNTDGYFDTLVQTYAVDGRDISINLLRNRSDVYEDSVAVFNGVGVSWVSDRDELTLHVREKSFFLDVPLLSLFGGTGSGDGTSANVGHPVPQTYGLCRNIVAELVDPALLIFKFHDRTASAVLAVYDRGAPVTAGSAYASYALLAGASTASGHYDYALTGTGSYFRLGSSPSGTVTADVRGDADGGYASTTGSIIKRLMLRGTILANIDTVSLDEIDAMLTGEVGIYFNSQLKISNAIDQVCSGTFTFWGDIGNGLLGAFQLTDPSGVEPAWEVNEFVITGEVAPLDLPDTIGPTVWRRRIGYQINWNPLSGTDIVPAPTITDARRKELQDPFLSVATGDSARLNKNLLAIDAPVLVSIYDAISDANDLADLLLLLYQPGRRMFSVPVNTAGYLMRLNQVVLLKWRRFGLTVGVNMRICGIAYQGENVLLTVFG